MMKSKDSPKEDSSFGRTFTKSTSSKKRDSINPFDSQSSSESSEYHEVTSTTELVSAEQTCSAEEEINCDSLERAYKDLEKSIEYLEARTQVPKLELDSSDGTDTRTTNLSILEEAPSRSPTNSSFEGSLRLSPRMTRATILGPRSTSPNTSSPSLHLSDQEGQINSAFWEKRSSSPGVIEYLADYPTERSPKRGSEKVYEGSKSLERSERDDVLRVGDSLESVSDLSTQASRDQINSAPTVRKNSANVEVATNVVDDEFFFDERDFYEISDLESDISIDEFELRLVFGNNSL